MTAEKEYDKRKRFGVFEAPRVDSSPNTIPSEPLK
jgi:hypothetical protein